MILFFLWPQDAHAEEMVTVKLVNYLGNTSELQFYLTGKYFSPDSTISWKEGVKYRLNVKNGHFLIEGEGKTQEIDGPLQLIPELYDIHHVVRINRRPYLGAIEFQMEKERFIRPVNQLPVEDYLKGVVPFEVFPTWKLDTLKAQTLAARTYTQTHLNAQMDDTVRFQAYGGYAWNPRTTQAVEETKGQVITYHNHLIDAFYSASNGGITENNTHVWGGKPEKYYPIKKDPYDPVNPWEIRLSKVQIDLEKINWDQPDWWEAVHEKDEDISNTMKNWLANHGYLGELKILSIPKFILTPERNESNRSLTGSITVEFLQKLLDGTVLWDRVQLDKVSLNYIRPMLGGSKFKSYLIDSLKNESDVYVLKGKGYGHGVGMSQWGASIMGDKGKTYKQIIQFYFPGTNIVSDFKT